MVKFLLGVVAGSVIQSNPRVVGRTMANLLVKTEDAAAYVAHQARRVSARLREDYEDVVVETREGHDSVRNPGGT